MEKKMENEMETTKIMQNQMENGVKPIIYEASAIQNRFRVLETES